MNLPAYIAAMALCYLTAYNSVLWRARAERDVSWYPSPEDSAFAVWFFHRQIGHLWFYFEIVLFVAGFFFLPYWAPLVGAIASPFVVIAFRSVGLVGTGFIPIFGFLALVAAGFSFALPPLEP